MEQMHILILPMYYPERDSSPHRGYMFTEQAMQLAHAGCRVGLAFVEQRPTARFTWKRFWRESHFQVSSEDNGSFLTLRMHAWNPKLSTHLGGLIWCFFTFLLVAHYVFHYGKPQLIHAHFGEWAGYAARWVRKVYGIPYVVTEHASSINSRNVKPSKAKVLRKAYDGAEQIICVGTMLADNLRSFTSHPERVTVVPNFVDTDTFRFNNHVTDKEKQFTFISVGNLSKRKGFAELIHAFSQEFADMPHVSLVIVGDGEEVDNLRKTIASVHLTGRIHLTGRLSREQLAWSLGQSDAFVLASHGETFGIVVIEAMAAGLPAIGTICGGPEDIITPDTGYLVQPGDTPALAQKMKELYNEYERFNKLAIRQSIVDRFDFRLAGKLLTDIYREAIRP